MYIPNHHPSVYIEVLCTLLPSLLLLKQAQHQRWVWDAVFSADSFYIVTASSDTTAKLWDVRTSF